jgi:quercetin dioxygenase-like cupin family protein
MEFSPMNRKDNPMNPVAAPGTDARSASPIDGDAALWFLDNLVRIRLDAARSDGGLDVVEVGARRGDMPPLHVHHREDEYFVVLEGAITVFTPGNARTLNPGEALHAPRGVPHTYRIESAEARWLAISNPSGFAGFVAEVAEPAGADELPPEGPPVDPAKLGAAAAAAGIEILGPPGTLP